MLFLAISSTNYVRAWQYSTLNFSSFHTMLLQPFFQRNEIETFSKTYPFDQIYLFVSLIPRQGIVYLTCQSLSPPKMSAF